MTDRRYTWIVANDDLLARALREQRAFGAGWQIASCGRIDDAQIEADALVLIDLDRPEARRESVAALRATGFEGQILVLGGESDGSPRDEAIPRPVRLGALVARIQAHARWSHSGGALALGPYEFIVAEYALRDLGSGRLVRLTELEQKLLNYLIDADGGLVDREELLQHVWGYRAGADTHTVETHIWRLRQKIETDDPATRFVVTETGGYRLGLVRMGRAS